VNRNQIRVIHNSIVCAGGGAASFR
jgi:hypothetical protein